jgi:hypothetical protein
MSDPTTCFEDDTHQALRAGGLKALRASGLFPTPMELATRMVALANPRPGARVLEPAPAAATCCARSRA